MQLRRTNTFQRFDFGVSTNKEKYGSETPPLFDLTALKSFDVESTFYIGSKDALATVEDFEENIGNNINNSYYELVVVDDYNHLDYAWAADANTKIYNDMIEKIDSLV